MHGIVIIAIVLGVLWALIVSRSFRIVVGLLVLGVVVWLAIASSEAEKQKVANEIADRAREANEKSRQEELWSRVPPDSVELRNPQLLPDVRPAWSSPVDFKLSGSIKNRSSYKLSAFEIDITVRDCADRCETVGHSLETIWVDIPPQEVRGIGSKVTLANLPALRGKLAPQFTVKRVYAGDFFDLWGVSK
ncbi:hypothetical protein JQ594_05215 [Bradyrhizobium manausense]|uniref:hypothetical protein n=1 Tax=Bradyrhizobium manausense TaxID=989370 RepID=UPI001BAACF56|nr:hypothetical protein [Bradyrhizobium manausense]MBR0685304.1 hypothetical protein [Bradyrhizobium manausense]